jgi:hypothetical protein
LIPVKDEEGNFIIREVLEEVCDSCRAMMRHPAGVGEVIVVRKPVADEGVVPIPMLVPCWKANSLRSFTLSGRWSGRCSGRLRLRRLQLRASEGLKEEEVEALPEPGEPSIRCIFALCKLEI